MLKVCDHVLGVCGVLQNLFFGGFQIQCDHWGPCVHDGVFVFFLDLGVVYVCCDCVIVFFEWFG